jgi:hypothetical protein
VGSEMCIRDRFLASPDVVSMAGFSSDLVHRIYIYIFALSVFPAANKDSIMN